MSYPDKKKREAQAFPADVQFSILRAHTSTRTPGG